MGTYRVFIVSLLFLASSSALQQESYKVEGVVINNLTSKPLPRALVQIGGHAALSGPQGEFAFDGLSAGGVTATASKPGYFGAVGSSGVATVNIQVGPDIGKIVLKLTPEAIITGRVTGRDEEPLEGVSIQALTFRFMSGVRRQLMAVGNAVTDEDGNFRLAGLSGGRYYLVAHAGSATRNILGMRTSRSAQSYPPIFYYPGTTDLAAAAAVDLAPGQRMETEFPLSLLPAYRLAGTLVAAGEWKSVNPPNIVDAMGQTLFSVNRYDPQSGAFEFRAIPAGSYTMLLSGTDSQDLAQTSDRRVTVAQDVTDLKLSLVPGANIPVVVRSEFSRPRPAGLSCSTSSPNGQVQRSDCSDYPAAQVTLMSANYAFKQFTTAYRPAPDPSAVRIQGVAAGRYIVRAHPTFGGYVQSVRCGTQDLMQEELTVAEGGVVIPIEVVVRDDPATLKVVISGQPAQQATVVALRDGVPPWASNPVTGAGSGTRSMTLAPGTYKVFAFDSLESLDFADPEVLARYASQAASVTVAANEKGSVVVNVIHTGE